MKIKLENKEYTLKANGAFMKKYQDCFHTSMMLDITIATQRADFLRVAQLAYCAIEGMEETFEEWLEGFETPCFLRPEEAKKILDYLSRECEPTVKPKKTTEENESKKKKS